MDKIYHLEYALIGALLKAGLTPKAREIMTWLEPKMFLTFRFGQLYENIRRQARKDNVIDFVLLSEEFGESFADLAEIIHRTTTSANLEGYARRVRESWINRVAQDKLLTVAKELSTARDGELERITARALTELEQLLADRVDIKPILLGDLLDSYVEVLDNRTKYDFNQRLLFTGVEALDRILGGINATDVTVIAGRPGTGKTEFGLTITKNIVQRSGSVLFFSLEMDNFQLVDRLLSAGANVSVCKLRNPMQLDQSDYARIASYLGEAKKQACYFVDRGGLNAQEIRSITENHLTQTGELSAVVVDYLGLVRHPNQSLNKHYQITETMADLKLLAKDLKVPVILLCQLNRDVDGRGDKRPMNSDLRESGSIEQDASQIIMLYREKSYRTDCEHNYAELNVTKNRFGALGKVYMEFINGHFVACDQAVAFEAIESIENDGAFKSRHSKQKASLGKYYQGRVF